ncbi:peptide-methionine (S)-S-oxide reductase [Campylobacter sp. MIT 99-7217]|uniref:peptide-methionine (S)-S-oxide reductase MsrA n=1 Tax=Campylobacter sp. MIT 99-7217 TaxID=535091 RepID=UPI001158EF13|nr:peptide-methionine (S)-S-oxide reductase MsrA [Campylobacter sp. MIT 99-7217]TQR31893.1 peptide-methionine (S)-S-oxide reductase [Campylobacter sp. MIT 99-7217]
MKQIFLGGGCFWCIEAVFERVLGLVTEVGYVGNTPNPTYQSVCMGDGSIEVVRINYDEHIIKLEEILDIFFKIHDPTSLDRQGADVGVQYRSAIFFENVQDRDLILNFIQNIQIKFPQPILTQVAKLPLYTKAEEYHQHFFTKNPTQAYCLATIPPKLKKLGFN